MIDFPASPTPGQQFTAAGVTWTWDGAKWLPSGLAPTLAPGINDNRIINGDMRIDQRNNGAGGTTAGYTVDRWTYATTQVGKISWQRSPSGPANFGFPYALWLNSTSAYTPLAGDYFFFNQPIEADMITDFAWGAPQAQPITLSFWAWCSLTGTLSGAIRNGTTPTRSYPFTFSLPTASTWTKIVVTIPGDTGGTWLASGNGVGLYLRFDLGSGSTYRGAAGFWANGDYMGVTGSQSIVATNGATFFVTGVKLEIGSVATPFNRQSLAKSMADCQRYYQQGYCAQYSYQNAGASLAYFVPFASQMRAAPTVTFSSPSLTNIAALTANQLQIYGFQPTGAAIAAGYASFSGSYFASAEL